MNNLSGHEDESIILKKFEEFLMERENLLTKREKMVFEREKLLKERELKCNQLEDDILNKREKLVSDREELAQEREYKLYCREEIIYGIRRIFEARDTVGLSSAQVLLKPDEREIKLAKYIGFRDDRQCRDYYGTVELTDKDFKILGLDITDPYDEQDINYIKTLHGSYEEIMENAKCYLKLSYASK
jgi:hypothetical protein